jgi:hypothetical protein
MGYIGTMGDPGERGPRWNEREASLILHRALALQHEEEEQRQAPAALQRVDGASLAELEETAHELGVDPALVRRAAEELEARPRPVAASRWTGGPPLIVFERVLRGEAKVDAIEALVGVLQEALGERGQSSMVGRTFTWSSLSSEGRRGPRGRRELTITVVPRDGATRIRIEEQLSPSRGRLFAGLLGGVGGGIANLSLGIGLGALHSPLVAAVLWPTVFGSAYLGARTLYRRTVRQRTAELQGLLARVSEHLQTPSDAAALPAPPSMPRLT